MVELPEAHFKKVVMIDQLKVVLISFRTFSYAQSTPWFRVPRFSRSATLPICMFLGLVFSQSALASSVSITWEASVDPGVVGYLLYIGTTSGNYTLKLDVGNYTGTTVSGL